jgi:hypothetical protein
VTLVELQPKNTHRAFSRANARSVGDSKGEKEIELGEHEAVRMRGYKDERLIKLILVH